MKKKSLIIILMVFQISCKTEPEIYSHKIVEKGNLKIEELQGIKTPEKALLLGYLYLYGNECATTEKIKCKLLKALKIEDECKKTNIKLIKKWFKRDIIKILKMQKCPNLSDKGAIQNKIEKIRIDRKADTIQMTIKVIGMNTAQEKNWTIEQTETFIIQEEAFTKIKKNISNKANN